MDDDQWEAACQLSQDTTDDFDWRIGQWSETHGAGPQSDHSPGQCCRFITCLFIYLPGLTFDLRKQRLWLLILCLSIVLHYIKKTQQCEPSVG